MLTLGIGNPNTIWKSNKFYFYLKYKMEGVSFKIMAYGGLKFTEMACHLWTPYL